MKRQQTRRRQKNKEEKCSIYASEANIKETKHRKETDKEETANKKETETTKKTKQGDRDDQD